MAGVRKAGVVAVASLVMGLCLAGPAQATVSEHGYLTARDGIKLRYSVVRPDGRGPFPVLINYQGYAAGTDPSDNGVSVYTQRLLDRGYAVVGVSVRGTGCSQGAFDPFDHTMGQDGYDAVEWAARRPWSNGRVGMIGVSFGGITQLPTAAERPPHLRAIAPSSALSDLYRDVGYPGGILEYDFTFLWTGLQKEGGTAALASNAVPEQDADCIANYARHEVANTPDNLIPKLVLDHPFVDDPDPQGRDLWPERAPEAGFPKIQVPTFLFNAWQDEQLPGRIFEDLGLFAHPERVWANFTNGNHGRDYYSETAQGLTLAFLDRYVRGVDNGFERKVPHLVLPMETAIDRGGKTNEPAWVITRSSVTGLGARPRTLHLRSGGGLSAGRPGAGEGGDSYAYPRPAPDVLEPGPTAGGRSTGQVTWKAPVPPGGSVAYTTAPMTRDLVVGGPASLDLWLSSTATDTDVEAMVTEVRPDGQETYVQRGWLRASHRKLDSRRSTALRPYQTHKRADAEPLTPGKPALMRLEVFPFAHAFRKGSRLRLWIEAPTGHTGFWAFQPVTAPGTETVLHDAAHPSRLVLGELPGEVAHAPLPGCDTLRNQPCRTDPLAGG